MRGLKTPKDKIQAYIRGIVPLMQRGHTLRSACLLLKFPYTTVHDYYQKSEAVRIEIDAAETAYYDMLHNSVYNQAKDDGRLAVDVLSRIDKARWSARQEVTGADGKELIKAIAIQVFDNEPDKTDEKTS